MAHIIEDRVLESTITTGTGDITLAAAVTGFRRFSAVCAVADTVPYFIEAIDSVGAPSGDYEYGIGTYSAANTLTRTTISGSSNGGAAVNFAAGTKNVGIGLLKSELDRAKPAAAGMVTATGAAAFLDITGIPSYAMEITVTVANLSTNGTSAPLWQIGDSGGVETSGYLGSGTTVTGAVSSSSLFTAGFGLNLGSATNVVHGSLTLTRHNPSSNTWVAVGNFARSDVGSNQMTAGSKSLSATLDRIRLTTVGGVDLIDATTTMNVTYK